MGGSKAHPVSRARGGMRHVSGARTRQSVRADPQTSGVANKRNRSERRPAGERQGGVSAMQLGASLRALAEGCLTVGDQWAWEPAPDSKAAEDWGLDAYSDALARTLAEADVHAVSLLRSALEHAVVTAQAISAGRAFVPLTTGRTATEHAVRAQYLFDAEAPRLERAARRMNEWLFAIEEREWQRKGIVAASHPGADQIEDSSRQLRLVEERVAALGLGLEKSRNGRRHISGYEERPGPMVLSERYLSDADAHGVTTAIFKTKHAFMHGLETGLLSASVEVPSSFEVQLMRPQQMPVGDLAFSLLQVAFSAFNATRAMAVRFERGGDGDVAWGRLIKNRESLLETWAAPISSGLDEMAPDRPRTGLFGPLGNPEPDAPNEGRPQ